MSLGDREGVCMAGRTQRRASLPVGKAMPRTTPPLLLPHSQHTLCGQEPECLAPPLKHSRAPPLSRPQEFPFENRSITWQGLHSSLIRECRVSSFFEKKRKQVLEHSRCTMSCQFLPHSRVNHHTYAHISSFLGFLPI